MGSGKQMKQNMNMPLPPPAASTAGLYCHCTTHSTMFWPEVIKFFSCSVPVSMKFVMLIDLKSLTNANSFLLNITFVGIFIFFSRENFILS